MPMKEKFKKVLRKVENLRNNMRDDRPTRTTGKVEMSLAQQPTLDDQQDHEDLGVKVEEDDSHRKENQVLTQQETVFVPDTQGPRAATHEVEKQPSESTTLEKQQRAKEYFLRTYSASSEGFVDQKVDSPRGLMDLPEACTALILIHLSPQDLARGACVCTAFRDIFNADCFWERLLPEAYYDILALAYEFPRSLRKKEIFELLSRQVLLQVGTQAYWLDKTTGGACYSLSPQGLNIVWGDDDRYWRWIPRQGSRWPEIAYVKEVCWFQVTGELNCLLPPGSYTLSWRMRMNDSPRNHSNVEAENNYTEDHVYGWASAPAEFFLSLRDGSQVSNNHRYLTNRHENSRRQNQLLNLTPVRVVEDNWLEYDVGEFVIEYGQEGADLKFSVMDVQSGQWKSGLNLDGVVVRPTYLAQKTGKHLSVAELAEICFKSGGPPPEIDVRQGNRARSSAHLLRRTTIRNR